MKVILSGGPPVLVVPDAAITDVVGFSEEVILLTRTDKCSVCGVVGFFFFVLFCSSYHSSM